MASRSSRPKSSSSNRRELLALLLREGRSISDPTSSVLKAADDLRRSGLVVVERREFVYCAEPTDRDFSRTKNRSCPGRVYLRQNADEAGHDYRCPECERVVFPAHFRKAQHLELQITVCPDAVIQYVRDQLSQDGLSVKAVSGGVFRLEGAGRDVHVCIADLCADEQFLARDWARNQPTLYVVVDESTMGDRFLPEEWVTSNCLADVLCGQVDLVAAAERLAQTGAPQQVINASVPVYATGPRPIVAAGERDAGGRRFLVEVRNSCIRVNGIDVAAHQAKLRFQVFDLLWRKFLEDLRDGKAPGQFRATSIRELAGQLKKDDDLIRRTVNRFQEDIEIGVKKKSGDPIGREDVIETVRRARQFDKNVGYRINPRTVVIRPVEGVEPEGAATSRAASASRALRRSAGGEVPGSGRGRIQPAAGREPPPGCPARG